MLSHMPLVHPHFQSSATFSRLIWNCFQELYGRQYLFFLYFITVFFFSCNEKESRVCGYVGLR